jgi:hypothetical protein
MLLLTRRSARVACGVRRLEGVECCGVAGDVVVAVAAAGILRVVGTARRRRAGFLSRDGLSGDGAVKGAGAARAVAA